MWILVMLAIVVAGVVAGLLRGSRNDARTQLTRREGPKTQRSLFADSTTADFEAQAEAARREVEDSLPSVMARIESEADALVAAISQDFPYADPAADQVDEERPPVSRQPLEIGPSWMTPEEWVDRLAAYRRQRRSDRDIREVRANLERRGPLARKPPKSREELASSATAAGIVSRSEYMEPDEEALALAPGADGLPNARLERVRDRLLVVTPRGWVNPKSRRAPRAGLYSFVLRGTGYYEAAVKSGRFTPGAPVTIVREPDNEHDPNAIAVYAQRARNKSGYVPKGLAKRLAPLMDAGVDMVAISVRGSGAGRDTVTPHILICERRLLEHLQR